MKFYRKLYNTYCASYYHSLETMPIGAFNKCLSGDLTKVSKNGAYTPEKAVKAWARLFDQHLKAHGLPAQYTEYIKKMKKAVDFYNQAYNGQRWKVTKAHVYEAEAKHLLNQGGGEKIETTCARISKFMGFPVKPETCTVTEFYNYVAIMRPN